MQLPNKLYSYKNSTLSLIPVVMEKLKYQPIAVEMLYDQMRSSITDPMDFVSVMDCLYALRAVDINEDGEAYLC